MYSKEITKQAEVFNFFETREFSDENFFLSDVWKKLWSLDVNIFEEILQTE